jgi:hypothetical protein
MTSPEFIEVGGTIIALDAIERVIPARPSSNKPTIMFKSGIGLDVPLEEWPAVQKFLKKRCVELDSD